MEWSFYGGPEVYIPTPFCICGSFRSSSALLQLAFAVGFYSWLLQLAYALFPWQSVVEITTTVTNRYDELDEVVCELLPDKQTVV